MDTGRGTSHMGLSGVSVLGEGQKGCGDRGGIALGEIPNVDDGVIDAGNHHGMCIPT